MSCWTVIALRDGNRHRDVGTIVCANANALETADSSDVNLYDEWPLWVPTLNKFGMEPCAFLNPRVVATNAVSVLSYVVSDLNICGGMMDHVGSGRLGNVSRS